MDTGNDPRFTVLDRALEELKQTLEHGRIRAQFPRGKAAEAVARGQSALKALQYSYAEPLAIKEMPAFNELTESMRIVETLLGGPGFDEEIKEDALAVARTAWTIATVGSLADRLELTGSGLELGVDVVPGRVVSVSPHPEADKLQVTRVAAGRSLRVVTNDPEVKAEARVGVALLPPQELRGVVSQAMFLGIPGEGVLTDVLPGPAGRPEVPAQAYAETRTVLSDYIAGK